MRGKSIKLTPEDEKKIVAAVRSGASVTGLARQFGVSRPTIYRAVRRHEDKAAAAQVGTAYISAKINRGELRDFDAFVRRLGLSSRADALRRMCRVPSGILEPDPDLADAVRGLRNELSAVGRNVNQIAAAKNYERRRGQKLRISPDQQQLLAELLMHLETLSHTIRELEGRRASDAVGRLVAGLIGATDAAP